MSYDAKFPKSHPGMDLGQNTHTQNKWVDLTSKNTHVVNGIQINIVQNTSLVC